ncbi:MAG: hypothetical protein N2490_01440 [Ignavibacteria bacterium]|nr:hypothetical protein [Ignavibacteria bacterium]
MEYSDSWTLYICNCCGYRICTFCLSKHSGKYSNGGYKCSQCAFGTLEGPKEYKKETK